MQFSNNRNQKSITKDRSLRIANNRAMAGNYYRLGFQYQTKS